MPTLNPMLVLNPCIQQPFVDKDTGLALAGGYINFFVDNGNGGGTVPKDVYQLSNAPNNTYVYNNIGSTVNLGSAGTPVDETGADFVPYLFPYNGTPDNTDGNIELYFLQWYDAGGILQGSRQAWPNTSNDTNPIDDFTSSNNLIANPQFVEDLINNVDPWTVTVSGTDTVTQLAPGWDLITNGSGTVTVSRVSNTNILFTTNPPYYMSIQSSGISRLILRQQFTNAPRLLLGQYVSGYFVVASADGSISPFTMNYIPSNTGATQFQICTGNTTDDGNTVAISGTVYIDPNSPNIVNPDGATGFVDIQIVCPINTTFYISSIQVVSVENSASSSEFIPITPAEQHDGLFHYYQNSIILEPKETLLTGWDFGNNPFQFTDGVNGFVAAGNGYVADQTILQTEQPNSLAIQRSSAFMEVAPYLATTQGRFALIQYVDTKTAAAFWETTLSSVVDAVLVTGASTKLNIKAQLLYRSTVPPNTTPVVSWTSSGITVGGGWAQVLPLNDPSQTIPNGTIDSPMQALSFNQFELGGQPSSTAMFAMVIYSTNAMAAGDALYIKSISLVPNDFGIQSIAKTYDQTLRECQFYYEKSMDPNVLPSITAAPWFSPLTAYQSSLLIGSPSKVPSIIASPFSIQFKNIKRSLAPVVAIYNYNSGGVNAVQARVLSTSNPASSLGDDSGSVPISNWTVAFNSSKGICYTPVAQSAILGGLGDVNYIATAASIYYHYTCDARLGIVA